MRLKNNFKFILVLFSFFAVQTIVGQYKIPAKPKDSQQTFVYGYVKLLSERDSLKLTTKLKKYSDSTSTQIVVAIISRTEGEDIGFLAANWLAKWGIGQKGKDNGVLVLLARNDRKVYISTGYGVEHLLTDYISSEIVNEIIIPEFKKDDYYAGLDKGTDAIFKALNGEYKGSRKKSKDF